MDSACIGLTSSNRVTFARSLPVRVRRPPRRILNLDTSRAADDTLRVPHFAVRRGVPGFDPPDVFRVGIRVG